MEQFSLAPKSLCWPFLKQLKTIESLRNFLKWIFWKSPECKKFFLHNIVIESNEVFKPRSRRFYSIVTILRHLVKYWYEWNDDKLSFYTTIRQGDSSLFFSDENTHHKTTVKTGIIVLIRRTFDAKAPAKDILQKFQKINFILKWKIKFR